MTPHELKYQLERHNTEIKFFAPSNMKAFGDTMRNYGVCTAIITTIMGEENVECWELYRKRPVGPHRQQSSAFFRKDDFTQTFKART